eukprot:765190-Pleurochrysis_carterae.AAC.2
MDRWWAERASRGAPGPLLVASGLHQRLGVRELCQSRALAGSSGLEGLAVLRVLRLARELPGAHSADAGAAPAFFAQSRAPTCALLRSVHVRPMIKRPPSGWTPPLLARAARCFIHRRGLAAALPSPVAALASEHCALRVARSALTRLCAARARRLSASPPARC